MYYKRKLLCTCLGPELCLLPLSQPPILLFGTWVPLLVLIPFAAAVEVGTLPGAGSDGGASLSVRAELIRPTAQDVAQTRAGSPTAQRWQLRLGVTAGLRVGSFR